MMDAQKALVWRGNNFGVVTTPLLTPSRVPGYIHPARFHTPHTPHEVPLMFSPSPRLVSTASRPVLHRFTPPAPNPLADVLVCTACGGSLSGT
jgi:hypothetical protein